MLTPQPSLDHLSTVLIPQWLLALPLPLRPAVSLRAASLSLLSAACSSQEALAALVAVLSASPQVLWLDTHRPRVLSNAFSHGVTQSGNQSSSPLWDLGFDGSSQIVAIADSGVDYYRCYFADPSGAQFDAFVDLPAPLPESPVSQLTGYWRYMDGLDDPSGHGTHVAGSIVGNATLGANGEALRAYNGMAYNARLLVTDIGCQTAGGCACKTPQYCTARCPGGVCPESPSETYEPDDLNLYLFPFSYENGARIHSNSWGELPSDGSYGVQSQAIDTFVANNPDMLVLFAASNDGRDGLYTISPEGSSKNALTVGAAQTTNQGWLESINFTNFTQTVANAQAALCAAGYPQCANFTSTQACCDLSASACAFMNRTDPNCYANACCPAALAATYAGNPTLYGQANMATFSSRGFTKDGRIKPDVAAPGQRIISSNSQGTANAVPCGAIPQEQELVQKSGTSMATPVTAGNAAIVRQYLTEALDIVDPPASLMKAVLINSAVALDGLLDLTGNGYYQPLASLPNPWSTPAPSPYQGFGRIQLENALLAPFFQVDSGTLTFKNASTPDKLTSQFKMCILARGVSDNSWLKATLVWTDPPSSPVASKNLVNDLDLSIIHNYDKFLGNSQFSVGGVAIPDRTNNVEQIDLTRMQNGYYSIFVQQALLTTLNQSFSIVVSGSKDFSVTHKSNCLDIPLTHDNNPFWTIGNTVGLSVGVALIFFFFTTLLLLFLLRSRNFYYLSTRNDPSTGAYQSI